MLKKILQELILIKEALKDIQTNKRIVKEFAVKSCEDCQKENRMFEIIRILQWRGNGNYLSALSYDKNTKQILVNEDALMRAIQLANPGQAYRKIKLITHNDHKNLPIEYFGSDGTSRSEKNRMKKQLHKKLLFSYHGFNVPYEVQREKWNLCVPPVKEMEEDVTDV